MVQMPLSETFGSIEGIDPDDHFVLEKLVRKLHVQVLVEVSFGGRHTINAFHFLEIASQALPLHRVVIEEHLLGDVVRVKLIWLNVRLARHVCRIVNVFIFFANDFGSGVELFQTVSDGVLDVKIGLCEDILGIGALFEGGLANFLSNLMND